MRNLIFSALLIASAFQTALGQQSGQSGDWTYSVSGGYLTITGYTGSGGAISTPESLDGTGVSQLASWNGISIFGASNTSVTSVTINVPVQLIGDSAFQNCTGLTSVTIPSTVTSIGQYAFSGCTGQLVSSVISQLASNSASNYTAGQQSVIANPTTHNLYNTSQIQNMAVGDLVLTKNVGGTFTLNYDIEQSTDLQSWLPYQSFNQQITNLPSDKAFIRFKAKQ
jgi:hypothetical protein